MKVKKYELVRIIDKLKSVVQKNTVHPALGGVLVKKRVFNRRQWRNNDTGQMRGRRRGILYHSDESF